MFTLFPFPSVRKGQREFMEDVKDAVDGGNILIAHAPTGIGKTVAALSPSLQYAIDNEKTIFFLTSKRTGHKIAVDTLRLIKEVKSLEMICIDVISKQAMCPREIYGNELYSFFSEFCKMDQKKRRCNFFLKHDGDVLEGIKEEIMHVDELCSFCTKKGVCPHKAALEVGVDADVLVCDYNYLFAYDISENVLGRIEKSLDEIIVIVDEAHNLPDRIRSNLSRKLQMNTLTAAARGIKPLNRELYGLLMEMESIFKILTMKVGKEGEINVEREFVMEEVEKILRRRIEAMNYDDFVYRLKEVGEGIETIEDVRTAKDTKYEALQRNLFSVADFLEGWKTEKKCSRIFSTKEAFPVLSFRLLDPSLISGDILRSAHSTIMMSGTLCPTRMYGDILGATSLKRKEVVLKEYNSPFPKDNRLVVVTKELTTKYTNRSEKMYERIATKIYKIWMHVKGGIAIFFPSYELLHFIIRYLPEKMKEEGIIERRKMRKKERGEIYEKLKEGRGLLFAVQGGSLSESIDYESNILKAIIIVGLPLSPPTLEVKNIERYYVGKFGAEKGKLYGYIYPAITKVLQAAGRGIRSETDRCIIVLIDYRFAQFPYKRCLPVDYNMIFTDRAEEFCRSFFHEL